MDKWNYSVTELTLLICNNSLGGAVGHACGTGQVCPIAAGKKFGHFDTRNSRHKRNLIKFDTQEIKDTLTLTKSSLGWRLQLLSLWRAYLIAIIR